MSDLSNQHPEPFISVVIPTRHRNEQLSLCLERLKPGFQSLDASEYEIIVSDDGSESTAQVMISERHPWVRSAPGPRKGPAANRNSGTGCARGQFIAFTDDDCLPDRGWLAAFRQAASPALDVLEGKTTCLEGLRSSLDEAPVNTTGGNLWSCNMMIRRSIFERVGGFDEDFLFWCEDMDLHQRIRRAGARIQFVPEAVVDHPRRRRPSGWQMGLRWENRVLLWYKEGHAGSVLSWLPVHLLKFRVGQILQYPLQWDSVRALAELAAEFVCVITHLPNWERKYRVRGARVLQ